MSEVAICAQGIGKNYTLRHQQAGRRYKTLRDAFATAPKNILARLPFFSRSPARQSSEVFWALKDVSFEIKRGETVGIIGNNGAGKSTLLKLLSRITTPSTGRIDLEGRVASLLEVGTGFHPELTGRENIYLNGAILGMSRREIRGKFDEIVGFAEVERFLDTPVKRYSSGMYMRLAFAVAAHLEPEILVVDEVLAVGDAAFQSKCLGKMHDVARGGRTILFVSHNMAAIQQLCTRGFLFDQGRFVKEGPIHEVVHHYTNAVSTAAVSSVDLENKSRPDWADLRVRLKKISVNEGKPILHGEACRVVLDFETSRACEEVWFGVGFSGLDGMRYVTYDSNVSRGMMPLQPGDKQSISLHIDRLALQPGVYVLDLGVTLGLSPYCSDYLQSVAQIEVLPGQTTPSYLGSGVCGVRLDGRWTIRN